MVPFNVHGLIQQSEKTPNTEQIQHPVNVSLQFHIFNQLWLNNYRHHDTTKCKIKPWYNFETLMCKAVYLANCWNSFTVIVTTVHYSMILHIWNPSPLYFFTEIIITSNYSHTGNMGHRFSHALFFKWNRVRPGFDVNIDDLSHCNVTEIWQRRKCFWVLWGFDWFSSTGCLHRSDPTNWLHTKAWKIRCRLNHP